MTAREKREQHVKSIFSSRRKYNSRMVAALVDDVEAVMDEASLQFDEMIRDMAYVDSPEKPMALSLFACNVILSVYLPLKTRGVDVHQFGRMVIEKMKQIPNKSSGEEDSQTSSVPPDFAGFIKGGQESSEHPVEGEFVFEAFRGEEDDFDWGMNISSCAICHSFAKYDAMDLVPYMCATDDVMSDMGHQGLRRTGSIAVGAHHCDFIYDANGEASRIAGLYPDKIRLSQN
jgi:hypothetical protein